MFLKWKTSVVVLSMPWSRKSQRKTSIQAQFATLLFTLMHMCLRHKTGIQVHQCLGSGSEPRKSSEKSCLHRYYKMLVLRAKYNLIAWVWHICYMLLNGTVDVLEFPRLVLLKLAYTDNVSHDVNCSPWSWCAHKHTSRSRNLPPQADAEE